MSETQAPEANVATATSLPSSTLLFAHKCFDAARQADSQWLLQAIDAGLPVNLTNDQGNTLLMLATYSGHADLAKSLLARNADPNRLNDRGQSIIAGAVFKQHDNIVRILLDAGADPRLGTPNAIQSAYMFRPSLLDVLGAKEGDIGPDVPKPLRQAS